MISIKKESEKN